MGYPCKLKFHHSIYENDKLLFYFIVGKYLISLQYFETNFYCLGRAVGVTTMFHQLIKVLY